MKFIETYQVTKDGKIPGESEQRFVDFLKKNAGKFVVHQTTNERKRTVPQNSWFHKIVSMITEFLREKMKESGNELYYQISEERVKLEIKEKYLGWEEVGGQKRLRHTSNLSTIQMNELWEALQAEYAPLGLYLPDPNERENKGVKNENIKTD